jgi:hypothetical protein
LRPLRYVDLRDDLKLVNNWTTLNNWIRDRGFPPGHMVGRCRMWTDREVFTWIESQPTENNTPLKGIAKKARAVRDASNHGGA